MKIRLLGVAAAALTLAACENDPSDTREYRVVCHSGGQKTLDDFAPRRNGAPELNRGGIKYRSQTTRSIVRTTGDCTAYRSERPEGWKALIPS